MALKQALKYDGPLRTHVQHHNSKFIWGIDEPVTFFNYSIVYDVLMIQYLLNKSRETEKLVMDGIFGRKTHAAIKSFQKQRKGFCYVDGRIDPYKGRTASTKTNLVYTILHLNDQFLFNEPRYFADISRDPSCPSELRHLGKSQIRDREDSA